MDEMEVGGDGVVVVGRWWMGGGGWRGDDGGVVLGGAVSNLDGRGRVGGRGGRRCRGWEAGGERVMGGRVVGEGRG